MEKDSVNNDDIVLYWFILDLTLVHRRVGNMEKRHLTLLQLNSKKKTAPSKKEKLVTREAIAHIENHEIVLKNFESSSTYSTFSFDYTVEGKTWTIPFEVEVIIDTLILDFDGSDMPENIRIKASELTEKLVESLRFKHRDKFWSLSHYFIDNLEEYELRKKESYAKSFEHDWLRIYNLSKLEAMDEVDQLLFEVEDIHDLALKIVGLDGKKLCEYLMELGLITYKKVAKTEFEISFNETDEADYLEQINQKIIFAREVARYGYNIWVDYVN